MTAGFALKLVYTPFVAPDHGGTVNFDNDMQVHDSSTHLKTTWIEWNDATHEAMD